MANNLGIIAYGTPEDRQRLAAISSVENKSGSALIIEMIRKRYVELFGDLDPRLAGEVSK